MAMRCGFVVESLRIGRHHEKRFEHARGCTSWTSLRASGPRGRFAVRGRMRRRHAEAEICATEDGRASARWVSSASASRGVHTGASAREARLARRRVVLVWVEVGVDQGEVGSAAARLDVFSLDHGARRSRQRVLCRWNLERRRRKCDCRAARPRAGPLDAGGRDLAGRGR